MVVGSGIAIWKLDFDGHRIYWFIALDTGARVSRLANQRAKTSKQTLYNRKFCLKGLAGLVG